MLYMADKLIEQLETYRLDHKITQEELAEKLDIAFSTVNRWFNNRNKPSKIQRHSIEKFLKGKAGSNKKI